MKPSVGRVVLTRVPPWMNNGADVAPATIVRVWNDTCVNLKAHLDGNGDLWVTSAYEVDTAAIGAPRTDDAGAVWCWPPRV